VQEETREPLIKEYWERHDLGAVRRLLERVHGLSTIKTPLWLYERALDILDKNNGKGLCVDVGVWVGWTTIPMAYAGCDVIAVDTFTASDTHTGVMALERLQEFEKMNTLPDCYEIFLRNLELAKVRERVTPIKGESVEAALVILHRAITIGGYETADLIFLDADHSHDAMTQDLLKWQHILKPGGLFCGHDLNLVQGSLEKFFALKGWGYPQGGPDHIWWIRKPE